MIATKRFLAFSAVTYLLTAAAAQAQLVIEPVINAPPPVYAAPVYPAPYYGPVITTWDPHHRRGNFEYWRARRHEGRDHDHHR